MRKSLLHHWPTIDTTSPITASVCSSASHPSNAASIWTTTSEWSVSRLWAKWLSAILMRSRASLPLPLTLPFYCFLICYLSGLHSKGWHFILEINALAYREIPHLLLVMRITALLVSAISFCCAAAVAAILAKAPVNLTEYLLCTVRVDFFLIFHHLPSQLLYQLIAKSAYGKIFQHARLDI